MNAPGFDFHRSEFDLQAPEAWRALDRAVARWVVAHGGSPLLARTAGWASLADGQGDSALPLDGSRHGLPALDADALAALAAEAMVGHADDAGPEALQAPFVLDGGYFYLRRSFLHEAAVATRIRQRRSGAPPAVATDEAALDALFNGARDGTVEAQRTAVARVVGRRLFVLTGGPGTGKTTTVLRMLLMLLHDRAAREPRPPVLRVAAPTGKAAQRLSEALREGGKRLLEHPERPLPDAWRPHLDAALAAESGTLHRLLGSRGHHGGFLHHAGNRLAADIVVVDEASMLDLGLLRALLDALPDDAVLILVGDADQLTSVGTGSVLLDLVGALEGEGASELVRLKHCFRADQALVPVNEAIRVGDGVALAQAWDAARVRVRRRDAADARDMRRLLGGWCQGLFAALESAGAFADVQTGDAVAVFRALDGLRQRQLLCALREGEFGALQAHARIELALRERLGEGTEGPWYPGRAVMVTRNDYGAGLFNGDVGLCLRDESGALRVWFEAPARAGAGERQVQHFAPGNLPEHEGAFAITVHKSQGSEYGTVALLLPPDPGHRILSRQLLYTGVSRARDAVELWSGEAALVAALAHSVERAGRLGERLAAR